MDASACLILSLIFDFILRTNAEPQITRPNQFEKMHLLTCLL